MHIFFFAIASITAVPASALPRPHAEDPGAIARDVESVLVARSSHSGQDTPNDYSRMSIPDITRLNLGDSEDSVGGPATRSLAPTPRGPQQGWTRGPRQGEPHIPSYKGRNIFPDQTGRALPHEYPPPPVENWIGWLQKETPGETPTAQGHTAFPVKTSAQGFSKYTHNQATPFGTPYYHPPTHLTHTAPQTPLAHATTQPLQRSHSTPPWLSRKRSSTQFDAGPGSSQQVPSIIPARTSEPYPPQNQRKRKNVRWWDGFNESS